MNRFLRFGFSAFLLSTFIVSSTLGTAPSSARAAIIKPLVVHLTIKNEAQTCTWVTVYWGKLYTPWQKYWYGAIPWGHTANIPVNIMQAEPMKFPSELKVRAEFKKNHDCSGGTLADYHEQRKDIFGTQMGGFTTYVSVKFTGPPWSVKPIVLEK